MTRLLKRGYAHLEEALSAVLFLTIFSVMSTQVVTRYVFGFSLTWAEELSRYAFVWLTFVGAAFAHRRSSHIAIDFVYRWANERLPAGVRKVVWALRFALTVAFLVSLAYYGYMLADRSRFFPSQAMGISQFYLYISVAVGGVLYLLRVFQSAARDYRRDVGG